MYEVLRESVPVSWRELFSKAEIAQLSDKAKEALDDLEDSFDLPDEWNPGDDEKGHLANWLIQALAKNMIPLGDFNVIRHECHLEKEIPKICVVQSRKN